MSELADDYGMDTMRVLTVRQPWAWAIIHGGKNVENRRRSLGPYRGLVAIHAGIGEYVKGTAAGEALKAAHGTEIPTTLHFGAVIGVVDLVDVCASSWAQMDAEQAVCCLSRWAQMPPEGGVIHHLHLHNPRPLARPIPARGRLGLWRPDTDLETEIRDQLERGGA